MLARRDALRFSAAAASREEQLGSVPNLFRLIADSPAALEGYLGLNRAVGRGMPHAKTR